MKKIVLTIIVAVATLVSVTNAFADQRVIAARTESAPVVDGKDDETAWEKAQTITTKDKIANIDMTLKAAYTDTHLFLLVQFPDPDESRTHKSWVWDKAEELYKVGNDREDACVFKWALDPEISDLSVHADKGYQADVWFWKACRTGAAGYADDKIQTLMSQPTEDSVGVTSISGNNMFLLREADSGEAAYKTHMPLDFEEEKVPRFVSSRPSGSRSDVKAKGRWKEGVWTVEFSRALKTPDHKDVQLDLTQSYVFGISRYEIAGRKPNPKLSQPLYGSGDTNEMLTLEFSDHLQGQQK